MRAKLNDAQKREVGRLLKEASVGGGSLSPQDVVRAARRKRSPIHEWIYDCEDETAVLRYRVDRARDLLESYHVEIEVEEHGKADVVVMAGALSHGEGYRRTHDLSKDPGFAYRQVRSEWDRVASLLVRLSSICRVSGEDYDEVRKWADRSRKAGERLAAEENFQ